jgi:F-type H+-transporting ATPase subunit epsilon
MAQPFELEVLTPAKRVFKGQVTSLVVPAEMGYLGFLANHAPLVTTLVSGNLTYRDPAGSPVTLRVKGSGFLEVYKNTAVVLTREVAQ